MPHVYNPSFMAWLITEIHWSNQKVIIIEIKDVAMWLWVKTAMSIPLPSAHTNMYICLQCLNSTLLKKMHGVVKFAFALSDKQAKGKTPKAGKWKGKSHNQSASLDDYEDQSNYLIGSKFFFLSWHVCSVFVSLSKPHSDKWFWPEKFFQGDKVWGVHESSIIKKWINN